MFWTNFQLQNRLISICTWSVTGDCTLYWSRMSNYGQTFNLIGWSFTIGCLSFELILKWQFRCTSATGKTNGRIHSYLAGYCQIVIRKQCLCSTERLAWIKTEKSRCNLRSLSLPQTVGNPFPLLVQPRQKLKAPGLTLNERRRRSSPRSGKKNFVSIPNAKFRYAVIPSLAKHAFCTFQSSRPVNHGLPTKK